MRSGVLPSPVRSYAAARRGEKFLQSRKCRARNVDRLKNRVALKSREHAGGAVLLRRKSDIRVIEAQAKVERKAPYLPLVLHEQTFLVDDAIVRDRRRIAVGENHVARIGARELFFVSGETVIVFLMPEMIDVDASLQLMASEAGEDLRQRRCCSVYLFR